MRIDPAGLPFVALAAVPSVVCLAIGPTWLAGVLLLLPVAIALFFRDPDRESPADPALVLSPADGKVMHAGVAHAAEAPAGGAWQQVTIFLSVLDVHINRTPVAGVVTDVKYIPGSFLPAYRHDSHQNERSEVWIEHNGTPIVFRQVVGLLARRVVCRVKPGERLKAGDRIGLMKFGSRMDVFVPDTATLRVKTGETVQAGVTVIAELRRSSQ